MILKLQFLPILLVQIQQHRIGVSALEIHFLFFTPQGGAKKSKNEFREGTYTGLFPVYRG